MKALKPIGVTPEAIFDRLQIGICVLDARTSAIVFASREFCRILSYSSGVFARGCVSDLSLTHPDDRIRLAALQSELVAGNIDSFRQRKRYLRPDGSVTWVDVHMQTLRSSETHTWCLNRIEESAITGSNEIGPNSSEPVEGAVTWKWRLGTGATITSPGFGGLHGLPNGAPIPSAMGLLKLVHPDDRSRIEMSVRRGIEQRRGFTEECRIVLPTGEMRWLRAMATCLRDASGEVVDLLGATIDVTQATDLDCLENLSVPMRKILRHIERHWNEPVSVKKLARLYGISPKSIHNHFAARGTTPNRLMKRARLNQARARLQDACAAATVTAIAVECGFSNMGHFARDYREEFGELPSATLRHRAGS